MDFLPIGLTKYCHYEKHHFNLNIFSNPTDRNLFRHGSYQELKNEEFQFEITQQDYENAEDCDENCD
mgnify:CR=1 FL=1